MLSRYTEINWRQGDILSLTDFPKGDLPTIPDDKLAVAISHSCDIYSDEPNVEFVTAKIITECDGNNTLAKHPRILHIPMQSEDRPFTLELNAKNKFIIQKDKLSNFEPNIHYVLDQAQRKILEAWLSARYRRHALPEVLQARLSPVFEFLEDLGKKNSDKVLGYWIDYDPINEELTSDQTYDFFLYIVYLSDNPEWGDKAHSLASQIKEKFSNLMKKTADMGSVRLIDCKAYSDEEFTIKDHLRTIQYRVDHLSYRTNPHGKTFLL